MSAATGILATARRKFEIATAKYWEQRRNGGIRELDPGDPQESDDIAAGAKYKATTPAAAMVLGVWQKCKAELDQAAANDARERGRTECAICPGPRPMGPAPAADEGPMPDPRLPPERDAEGSL